MTCGHTIVKIISLLFTDVTLVLSGSQYNSSCPSYISTRAGKRLCCSTMSRWCSLPRAGTSRSSRPCWCCRTRVTSFHSRRCSPPVCRPARRNLNYGYNSKKDEGLRCFQSCRTVYHSFHQGFFVRARRRSCMLVSGQRPEEKPLKAPSPPLPSNRLFRSVIQG